MIGFLTLANFCADVYSRSLQPILRSREGVEGSGVRLNSRQGRRRHIGIL